MTRIKICGVKREETLHLLARLDVDYVGLVFAESRRRVDAQTAGALLASVPDHPPAVGVFVNPTEAELEHVLAHVPLAVIQLHGQESPAFCESVRQRFSLPVWKALAVGSGEPLANVVNAYRGAADAFLFDTYDPRQAGGTGKRFSWEQILLLREWTAPAPCIIAGGINADNVAELVGGFRPAIIDVSSGVESDGEKDAEKIRQFVERVREHDRIAEGNAYRA
ncbi:phosphoribosylanthranilate isomerase [Brevibacillus sp. LEMMJ03]|uniref:phosphoribosylanthranilate isomerase n=1 Tax=Brevibacillus sp. LEMMJ03 TaxID=2595056 RepID=UPI00117DFCDD|nr:phosphoribosylanthranilate isomerase [Brevibacillus sp. LEMMJ03]TRY28150.1 phosphoribosylanthranilate isomerase [Brevibacillus sp. LEMMJ03]